ncbi:MAG: hypothetical protein WCX65_14165, partial [bacterium]
MTTRQKALATIGLAALIISVCAFVFIGPGRGPDGKRIMRFAVNAEDCLDASISLYEHGNWETAEALRHICEASDSRKDQFAERFDNVAKARARFNSFMDGWSLPFPAPDGTSKAVISPEEAAGRISRADQLIDEFPDDEVAELAAFSKATLLFYLGRYDDCSRLLEDKPIRATLPEYAGLLRVMALVKSGALNDAEKAADS